MKEFMRSFIVDTEYAIIDLTNVFSYSKGMINAMLGHNTENIWIPQIELGEYGIDYVFALKRNSEYIDYTPIIDNKRKFEGNFVFQKRNVWFYTRKLKDERIITYLDPSLKAKEENDLAVRIKFEEKGSLDEKNRKQLLKYGERLYTTFYRNGTLSPE